MLCHARTPHPASFFCPLPVCVPEGFLAPSDPLAEGRLTPQIQLACPSSGLCHVPLPQAASHHMTLNKWTWRKASGTICMRNLLQLSQRPGQWGAGAGGLCQEPFFWLVTGKCQAQCVGANLERKGRESCTQREVYSPAGHLTLGGNVLSSANLPLELNIVFFFFL